MTQIGKGKEDEVDDSLAMLPCQVYVQKGICFGIKQIKHDKSLTRKSARQAWDERVWEILF
jgi:hypothetical protein